MTIGYVLLMGEGVLGAIAFRSTEVPAHATMRRTTPGYFAVLMTLLARQGHERVLAIQSHIMMQLRSLLCILIGFGVVYKNKVPLRVP
jgi:cytochrome b-561 domain containing protein 2